MSRFYVTFVIICHVLYKQFNYTPVKSNKGITAVWNKKKGIMI